jgi:methionine synthase I (cobalamin-dependent)
MAKQWRAQDINMLGCCCGLGVEHIKALNRYLAA